MRSSKSQRGWLRGGLILACVLGLNGVILLFLARPIATPFPDRRNDEGFEVRLAARDAQPAEPDDAPVPWSSTAPEEEGIEVMISPPPPVDLAGQAEPAPSPLGDLATALRGDGLACLSERDALLSSIEREFCHETLGALARKALYLPTPIAREKRGYYDAVAQAQAPRRAMVPLMARGGGGLFGGDDRMRAGRGPRVGCSLKFGPNLDRAPKGPANVLRAGPCFVRPPAGPLTPEANVRKPY